MINTVALQKMSETTVSWMPSCRDDRVVEGFPRVIFAFVSSRKTFLELYIAENGTSASLLDHSMRLHPTQVAEWFKAVDLSPMQANLYWSDPREFEPRPG